MCRLVLKSLIRTADKDIHGLTQMTQKMLMTTKCIDLLRHHIIDVQSLDRLI